ncbi:hypothetical protein [Nostoc sp. LPT]|uniref:hypothetical protein n=1 Tax=Nostoc sp. LPT TaxID=2815387 RepID=UPI001DEDBE86|nr:hypothetical protein [Nostoc sp. LPT]MBN4004756.1 hypothetical protein [Nostoc sp. LPT]
MSKKGGPGIPWQPRWNSGKTKTIRVPIALVPQVLEYARALDGANDPLKYLVNKFLKIKRRQYSRAIHNDEMTSGNRWKIFNEFRRWLLWQKSTYH